MARALPKDWAAQHLPVFRVIPDRGVHPLVVLDRPVCVIGRDYDANLALDEPQVSRHHALVVRSRAGVYIRDLASTNGVRRNEKPVRETVLHNNDKLRVGTVLLRCDAGFDVSAARARRPETSDAPAVAADDSLEDRMPRLIDSTAG